MTAYQNYIAFYTIVRKEFVRIMRIWPQTLLPSVVTMGLYFLIFGKFLGSQLPNMQGFTYIQFIVPGLVMMAVLTNAYSNVATSFFALKFQRNIEELVVSPLSPWIIIAGFVSGGVIRGLLVGGLVFAVSLFFTNIEIYSYGIVLLCIIAVSSLLSLAGLINGLYANSFDSISIVPAFILTPLTYLGGVFYSINLLPPFWHMVSLANPIFYMVDAFRYGFLGVSDVSITTSLSVILGFFLVLFFITREIIKKGIGLKN